eukprot:GHVR01114707.1.p1 GENE.GHVR01114707.1~~GHVR01114707.1.p1  ORF type:complete len:401 (+),score=119.05 GHVR01114707.1:96-1298(+)
MTKKTVESLTEGDLSGKKVLVRNDFNVPQDEGGKITDDTRIRASLPTIKFLVGKGAKVICCSHLGRPKGKTPSLTLKPVAVRLTELLKQEVVMCDDCIGDSVTNAANNMNNGDVILLENVRFYKEEESNDADFAKKMASVADVYVNDAFGTAHRAHASTEGVTKYLSPSVAGTLMTRELEYLQTALENPNRPFVAIVGGAKISSKITVIEKLLDKVDRIILGGGMVYTFLKARGKCVGTSICEDDKIELAKKVEEMAAAKKIEFILPIDFIVADKYDKNAETQIVAQDKIPADWMALDCGPDSRKLFEEKLADAQQVIWNGPMGVFEFEKFAAGTNSVAKVLSELTGKGAVTIIGGGDSVAAVEACGLAEKMSHISTGGGASLELLEGKVLPGVAALNDA